MDTSKEYIEMCRKSHEIRNDRLPQVGDFYWEEGYVGIVRNRDNELYYVCPSDYKAKRGQLEIFLPRQDQLQEMWEYSKNAFTDIQKFTAKLDNRIDYYERFTSMEQLWLAFVMEEEYGKIWNGTGWVKEAQ